MVGSRSVKIVATNGDLCDFACPPAQYKVIMRPLTDTDVKGVACNLLQTCVKAGAGTISVRVARTDHDPGYIVELGFATDPH